MIRRVRNRITINCEELEGSPVETASAEFWNGTSATRTFRCLSIDRIKLINEFLGYWDRNVWHEPHSYTDLTFLCVATSAATKPVGKMSGQLDNRFAQYPKTDVTFTYTIPPETYEAFGGLITITETVNSASEYLTFPAKSLFWDAGQTEPLDPMDAPAKISHLTEWTYEARHVRNVPSGIFTFPGHINSIAVPSDTLRFIFPAGTLLCGVATVVRQTSFGRTDYDVTVKMLYKNNGDLTTPLGWNYFPNPSKTGGPIEFGRIYDDGGTAKEFYPAADLRPIVPSFGSTIVM